MGSFRFEYLESDAVRLHYAEIGDPENPPIICLHGFPEFWAAWRNVMEALCDRYFLVAPDQRGFNLSSKPHGVEAYRTRRMVDDLDRLANRISPKKPFVLAGHDWGASIAYAYAIQNPGRVSHLVIANGVHPACFQRAIFDDAGQRAASQYMNRLKSPEADDFMAADGFRRTLKMISGFSRTDWMTPDLKAEYLAAWAQPGAVPAMLNWYRASPIIVPAPGEPVGESKVSSMPDEALRVSMPHLVVWGEEDEALRPVCIEDLPRYASDLTVKRVSRAGHWILHEQPKLVADAMSAFLGR